MPVRSFIQSEYPDIFSLTAYGAIDHCRDNCRVAAGEVAPKLPVRGLV